VCIVERRVVEGRNQVGFLLVHGVKRFKHKLVNNKLM
jgi:hypothetical protein